MRLLWDRSGRRARLAERTPDGPLREYLRTPPPPASTDVAHLPLLALDLETTGLDPARDSILSIGLVPVDGRTITLAGARRTVVRGSEVGPSATVHGLTDDVVAQGVPLDEALDEVLTALTGRVLLAHHAAVERRFLAAACAPRLGGPLPLTVVDTMDLAHRVHGHGWGDENPEGGLRLQVLRARHGLPRYRSHEALTDALACAELYLALIATLEARHAVTLGGLLRHRRL